MLFRVFPLAADADIDAPGGPLFVPRAQQGQGRHDAPAQYGALYVTRSAESAVAERIQGFRGRILSDRRLLLTGGRRLALAAFREDVDDIVDLDDPVELLDRSLRPSHVATRDRDGTQSIARQIFQEGAAGIGWWSTLEASWANVTLFAERVQGRLNLAEAPQVLTVNHPAVVAAADVLGIRLAR